MTLQILLFLESLGTGELLLILVFVLFFFGSKKIPELARGLGKGMREMNDAVRGIREEITSHTSFDEERKMVEGRPPCVVRLVGYDNAKVAHHLLRKGAVANATSERLYGGNDKRLFPLKAASPDQPNISLPDRKSTRLNSSH